MTHALTHAGQGVQLARSDACSDDAKGGLHAPQDTIGVMPMRGWVRQHLRGVFEELVHSSRHDQSHAGSSGQLRLTSIVTS